MNCREPTVGMTKGSPQAPLLFFTVDKSDTRHPENRRRKCVDFLALTTKRVPHASALELALTAYSLRPDELDPDAVYVEISGRDRTGFLSGILKQFSLFSLFPTKMIIDTKDGLVFDRFWIKGIGASKPSDDAIASIRRNLGGLMGN